MNKVLIAFGTALLAVASSAVNAGGDAAAGATKAKEICAACHGADGNSPSGAFPKLAGQWPTYLEAALHQYAIMAPQAQNLTNQEIADLAAYFSQQPAALHVLPAH